jgi:hypothetical protein
MVDALVQWSYETLERRFLVFLLQPLWPELTTHVMEGEGGGVPFASASVCNRH